MPAEPAVAPVAPAPTPTPNRRRSAGWGALGAFLLLLAALATCELLGWPFLAGPLQGWLSGALQRRVLLGADADPGASADTRFSVHFLGGVHLRAPRFEIAAPAWSDAPYLVSGRDGAIDLRYTDLWRAWHGQPQRIESLRAAQLDAHLERRADGSASWQFGPPPAPGAPALPLPAFGSLQVVAGTLSYRDAPLDLDVQVALSLVDGAGLAAATTAASAPARASSTAASAPAGRPQPPAGSVLQAQAIGRYQGSRLKVDLQSSGVMPWSAEDGVARALPLRLQAQVGRASLVFEGSAVDVLHLRGLSGSFSVKGPSLAAVGRPLGLTLPTTATFRTDGRLVKQGTTWRVLVDEARIGASRLNGAFSFDTARPVPLLAGRLGGSRLALADLGPAVGTAVKVSAADGAASAAAPAPTTQTHGRGKVLPDRPFDLAALRAMDANVLIDITEVDLDTTWLEPVRPLHGHLVLAGGVLRITDLDARTGQGRLTGDLSLDGRGTEALWQADLGWDGLRLERFIHQNRAAGAPPYVSGRLSGHAKLSGQGRSTADILGSLKGQTQARLHDGTVSHLVVELAGLDVAQGLGMLIKGDDSLPVQCAVADVVVSHGVFTPRVMVLDTLDSAIWIDGSLSLATEALNLRAVVVPKDFSPLALRSPIEVHGTLAQPVVSVQKGPVARKLAGALLLGLINPLAALIPLIDTGNAEEARRGAAGCKGLVQRAAPRTQAKTAAPSAPKPAVKP